MTMDQFSRFAGLAGRALFLRTDAYEEMREARNPFVTGLLIIVIVGLIIAFAGLVGTVLEWASSPDMGAVQDVVYQGLIKMPWYQEQIALMPDFANTFKEWYERGWSFARLFGSTSLGSAAGNIILTPLGLIIGWLIYGLLAHFFARLLKGEANLGQTLGCIALAVGPQVLKAAEVLPFVSVGGVVGTWVLICRYVALKQAHRLTWGRAFWATVLPILVLGLVGLILAGMGVAIASALASQFFGGGVR
jgi:hypothetical protein